jgi:hypothetical protein
VSGRAAVVAALLAALRAEPGLAGVGVFDGEAGRAALPHVVVGEPVLAEWATKSWAGLEGRVAIALWDGGEAPGRVRGWLGAVEAAVGAVPAVLGDGWRSVQLRVVRSRVERASGRWRGTAEVLVRVWREG